MVYKSFTDTTREGMCIRRTKLLFMYNFVVKHAEIYSKNDCPFFSFRVTGDPSSVWEFNH